MRFKIPLKTPYITIARHWGGGGGALAPTLTTQPLALAIAGFNRRMSSGDRSTRLDVLYAIEVPLRASALIDVFHKDDAFDDGALDAHRSVIVHLRPV